MPADKTHAIHGEFVIKKSNTLVEIDMKSLRTACMGPDALISTDYKVFDNQHKQGVKEYFETMLKYIKENKLQDNREVMTFLYGQLDHYITDLTCHPLIYYYTENVRVKTVFSFHAIVELWIDDYIMSKYHINKVEFSKQYLNDKELRRLIDELYLKIYKCTGASEKFSLGVVGISLLDKLIVNNGIGIAPLLTKILNIGDIIHSSNLSRILPYLNFEHSTWTHPVNEEKINYSFDDLWEKSIAKSLETFEDVNNYLYKDMPFRNYFIKNNISYNTGFPCVKKETFPYVRKKQK